VAQSTRGKKQAETPCPLLSVLLALQLWPGPAQWSSWRQLQFFLTFTGGWSWDRSRSEAGMRRQRVLLPLLCTALRCRPSRLCARSHLHLPCLPLPDALDTCPQLHGVNSTLRGRGTALLVFQAIFSGGRRITQNTEDTLRTRGPTAAWGSGPPRCRQRCSTSRSARLAPRAALACQHRHPLSTPRTAARLPGALGSHRNPRIKVTSCFLLLVLETPERERPGVEPCRDRILRRERSGLAPAAGRGSIFGDQQRVRGEHIFTGLVPDCSSPFRSSGRPGPDRS